MRYALPLCALLPHSLPSPTTAPPNTPGPLMLVETAHPPTHLESEVAHDKTHAHPVLTPEEEQKEQVRAAGLALPTQSLCSHRQCAPPEVCKQTSACPIAERIVAGHGDPGAQLLMA